LQFLQLFGLVFDSVLDDGWRRGVGVAQTSASVHSSMAMEWDSGTVFMVYGCLMVD